METKYVDQLRDAFFVLDRDWRFAYVNNEAVRLLQKPKEELLGTFVWEEFKEAVDLTFYEQYNKALNENKTVEFQDFYGPLKTWFDVRAYPVDEGLAVHFRDISSSKRLLNKNLEYYRSLFDHNPDAVFSFDLDGNYQSINESFEKLLGYSREEYLSMNFKPLVIPEHLEKTNQHFQLATKGQPQHYEVTCLKKNGEHVHLSVTNVPIVIEAEIVGVYGIAKDITKNKQIELELKEREASLRSALRVAQLGSWEWDLQTDQLIWSEEMKLIVGWDFQSVRLSYQKFLSIVHPLDREKLDKQLKATILGMPFIMNFRIMQPNGQIRYLESMGEVFLDDKESPVKVIGTSRDVTERMIERESLQRSEQLYELITENSQDMIMYLKPSGTIRYVSPAVEKILAYEPNFLLGQIVTNLIHEEDVVKVKELVLQNSEVFTARIRHKEGHYVWIETSIKIIQNQNGTVDKILAIGRDITERVTARELMIKSEKLNLAGQLAAGIAHEIRNPLTAIKGFLQLMEKGHSLRPEYFNIVGSELSRIEFILNELLLLAKPTDLNFARREANAILSQIVLLLETEALLKDIEIITNLQEELFINCDENQLKQVFINFVKNAFEAMPHGGKVYIESKREQNDAIILFKDEGCGIPKEKLRKIGQPFYTTKEKGTGLGLAVSFSIIENHLGSIHFDSEENKGTTVAVKLPLWVHDTV